MDRVSAPNEDLNMIITQQTVKTHSTVDRSHSLLLSMFSVCSLFMFSL